jgi:hypothetical protein
MASVSDASTQHPAEPRPRTTLPGALRQAERRAEQLLVQPRPFPQTGTVGAALTRIRGEALDELGRVDAELAQLAARRGRLVRRVVAADRALLGTGVVVDAETGAPVQRVASRGRRSTVSAVRRQEVAPPTEPCRPVGGRRLRALLVELVSACEEPDGLTVAELVAVLAHLGIQGTGRRPEQAIANQLAAATREGRLERVRRGRYRARRAS